MLMVQANTQPMKTSKLKGPPPVPPRPNQNIVAEALAKTRKAVADSKTKSRSLTRQEHQIAITRSKTIDRVNTVQHVQTSPKQNGLARVKSFIRDVINRDSNSSSDEKKSSGQNSRRSSSDSSSIPAPSPTKRSNESIHSKITKNSKQVLVRSLSTSNKLDQDAKSKVSKSSSFAEKTFPLRKAPPPPLSPKPDLKLRSCPTKNNSVLRKSLEPKQSPEVSPYSSPIDAKPPQSPLPDAPYATVEEVQQFDDRLRNSPSKQVNKLSGTQNSPDTSKCDETINRNSLERKTSQVTEMLISEILASRNNNTNDENIVIDKGKDSQKMSNGLDSPEITKDMNNHEMLIYELQTMRSQSSVPETIDSATSEINGYCESDSEQNYARSSVNSGHTDVDDENDQSYAYILDDDLKSRLRKQFRAISTMSLQGLPPLPKSLSGFADMESTLQDSPQTPPEPPPTDLDSSLTYLKKEMVWFDRKHLAKKAAADFRRSASVTGGGPSTAPQLSQWELKVLAIMGDGFGSRQTEARVPAFYKADLRQLDLSLLSELWTLSETMASWRRQLERGHRLRPAPPPPPPPHYLRT